jgi:aldose 1-epimerase
MGPIVELQAGVARARLLPAAGGRISTLRLAQGPEGTACEVLHPYPEDFFDPLRWAKGGIYPLIPYSNRIAEAQVEVRGRRVALRPHPEALPHTLHGNAHAQPWTMEATGASSATMVLRSAAGPAWPWRYEARMHLALAPDSLVVQMELRNRDDHTMPAGLGLHPYFRHQPDAALGYRASAVWDATPEFIATAARAPTAGEDHTHAQALPPGGLTRYVGGWDGHATVALPEGALLRIHADGALQHLVVHRPDNLAYLCLEPVSHVADGFNLAARGVADTGTQLLAPGESLRTQLRFQLLPAGHQDSPHTPG